ncbi:CO6A5-like protein, partial [Mya arenaria]
CDTKADVTFLLDSSDNVGKQNFLKQLTFVKDVTNNFQLGQDKVQVSAVTFGTGAKNQFDLNQYRDHFALNTGIMNIPYNGGQPKVANALHYATGSSFSPLHGGRADAPHIAVVLTNQPSGSIDTVKLQSQTAKDNGVIIYAVGIGNAVDMSELQAMASDPDSRHLYTSANFDALGSLTDLLSAKICNGCLTKADVVFMVDSSTSVGAANFQKLEHFLKDVMTKVDIGANKVQMGVVKYGNYPSLEFSLNAHQTRPDALKAIETMTYLGGGTNDADAFTFTGNQVLSQYKGARGNVPRIAIMITDGGSANPQAAIAAADKLRQENVGIITVGVGNQVNQVELTNIADAPSSEYSFHVNSYGNLDSITDKLISQMCKVTKTQPPISTGPGATAPPDPCQDAETNCAQYGADVCTNYASWAQTHCSKFCGFCTPLVTAMPPKCEDQLPDCSNYGRDYCSQPGSYVAQNCQLFCGLCGNNTSSVGYYGQCFYKGKSYATGEKWYDGCEYECVCEDGSSGKYKCSNRCPVYHDLPGDCTLVGQPGECCLQPVCNFNPQINAQTSNARSTAVSLPTVTWRRPLASAARNPCARTQPTAHPPCVDVLSSCSAYGKTDELPKPGPSDRCVFGGKLYEQGNTWNTSCDTQCTCENAIYGYYRCVNTCPTYNNIPKGCTLVKAAGDCCSTVQCQSGMTQVRPTLPSGETPPPGTGGTGFVPPTLGRCPSYPNLAPSCHLVVDPNDECCKRPDCTPDPVTHQIPIQIPVFLPATQNHVGVAPPAYSQLISGQYTAEVTLYPPGITPAPPTVNPNNVHPGGVGYCTYNGQKYTQGQTWEDGCNFNCICDDASRGHYQCTENYQCTCEDAKENVYRCLTRCPEYANVDETCTFLPDPKDPSCCQMPSCPSFTTTNYNGPEPTPAPTGTFIGTGLGTGGGFTLSIQHSDLIITNPTCSLLRQHVNGCPRYTNIPEYCVLVTDFANPCCKKPRCNFPPETSTMRGTATPPTGTTRPATPPPPGQTAAPTTGAPINWINSYELMKANLCASYDNAPATCRMVTDPSDSCCLVPVCSPEPGSTPAPVPGQSTTPYNVPTAPPGEVTGSANVPTPKTGETPAPLSKCQKYVELPSNCRLARDPTNPCCQVPECGNPTPAPLYTPAPNPNPTTPQPSECPHYAALPKECRLVPSSSDPLCCKEPKCEFVNTKNQTSGYLTPPTPPPGVIDGGVATPTPPPTLAPSPGYVPPSTTPGPIGCMYNGVLFKQGETWNDGCDLQCVCEDQMTNVYRCRDRYRISLRLITKLSIVLGRRSPENYVNVHHITHVF